MESTNHRNIAGDGPPEAATLDEVPQTVPEPGLIRVPARHNPLLAQILARINADRELQALWRAANVNAVDRLGMADHGRVHVQIVANVALRLLWLPIE